VGDAPGSAAEVTEVAQATGKSGLGGPAGASGPPGVGEATTGAYGRDTVEFARLVNLSDAVFAIAMTLLVLGLAVPDVPAARLGAELMDIVPQLLAFLLSFALVANIWWQHHKLFARLARIDRSIVALSLAMLGVVALVPFPTGLLGSYPTSSAAAVPFIGIFAVLLALFVGTVARAQRLQAWTRALPVSTFRWVVAGFLVTLAMVLVAAAVALVWPVVGLVVLAVSNLPEVLLAHRAPPDYREWS
jgi:uncharacterized membrane protein